MTTASLSGGPRGRRVWLLSVLIVAALLLGQGNRQARVDGVSGAPDPGTPSGLWAGAPDPGTPSLLWAAAPDPGTPKSSAGAA